MPSVPGPTQATYFPSLNPVIKNQETSSAPLKKEDVFIAKPSNLGFINETARNHIPTLQVPETITDEEMQEAERELDHLLEKVASFERLYFELTKNQVNLHEAMNEVDQESMAHHLKVQKSLRQEYFKLKEEMSKIKKKNRLLRWLDRFTTGAGIGFGVLTVGLLAASIFTGGLALIGLFATVGGGCVAAAQGTLTLVHAESDMRHRKKEAHALKIDFQKEMEGWRIQQRMGSFKDSMTAVLDKWKKMREVQKNFREITRLMISR